ncbi:hypothetical protein ACHAWO_012308 [Cyclotella atomus]|uniref:Uncharacterized protein n=1 Tax=Cyclotella atomus TaxID=382360 RepID=A0ABD3NCK9_9STRA
MVLVDILALDSGFVLLKAVVGLCQHGVFSGALIKSALQSTNTLRTKPYLFEGPGSCSRLCGLGLFYNSDRMQPSCREWCSQFQSTGPFEWHCDYRHLIGSHNNKRLCGATSVEVFEDTALGSRDKPIPGKSASCCGFKEGDWPGILFPPIPLIEPVPNVIATEGSQAHSWSTMLSECRHSPHAAGMVATLKLPLNSRYNQFTCKARGCKKRLLNETPIIPLPHIGLLVNCQQHIYDPIYQFLALNLLYNAV